MEVVRMPLDYENLVSNLMQTAPSILAVAIVENKNEIVYSTNNWDIREDITHICLSWNSIKAPFIIVSGIKYTMLECEIDIMVATSILGKGHIVGVKDEELKIITYVEPDGDRKAAIVELSRILRALSSKEPYMSPNTQFETKYEAPGTIGAEDAEHVNPQLKSEIEEFLNWIKNPDGLLGYINYYFQQNNAQMISELAKIYEKEKKY
jgi:hypothetical protein